MSRAEKWNLPDVRIAVMVSDGFDETELNEAMEALRAAQVTVEVLAQTRAQSESGIQGMKGLRTGIVLSPRALIQDVEPARYHGVLIPGGALSVDRMRESPLHLGFLKNLAAEDKVVAAIGHGPWLLADSGDARGRTLTSAPSIRKDLERAGAIWKDQSVIEDVHLITARGAQDTPRLMRVFLEHLARFYQARKVA